MVQAIGYVTETFDPASPGRLCRGRERWIEYETMGAADEYPDLHRVVLSGATFSDDRARDARRGLNFGPIDIWSLLRVLLGDGLLIAYCEEGHPHEVPENVANTFRQKYPNAPEPTWEVDTNGSYEANYRIDGAKYRADFTKEGIWTETENNIDFNELPPDVRSEYLLK